MTVINIHAAPMNGAQLRQMRTAIERDEKFEDSIAFKTFLYCPVPVLDVVAGLAVAGVTSLLKDDPKAALDFVRGSTGRDWSTNNVTEDYVRQVRAQGRDLVAAEVEALEQHLKVDVLVSSVMSSAVSFFTSGVAANKENK